MDKQKSLGFFYEFRKFALKGNAIDLATAVIVGGAFGKIVSSIVEDIIMPPLGLLLGRVDFKDFKLVIQHARPAIKSGQQVLVPAVQEVAIRYGAFLQHIFDFSIISVCIFLVIKGYHRLHVAKEEAELTRQEKLLIEIRDLLKEKQK